MYIAWARASDDLPMTDEFRNDVVRAIMRAWYAVQDCGGWLDARATRNLLPPPPPAVKAVRDPEPERG